MICYCYELYLQGLLVGVSYWFAVKQQKSKLLLAYITSYWLILDYTDSGCNPTAKMKQIRKKKLVLQQITIFSSCLLFLKLHKAMVHFIFKL